MVGTVSGKSIVLAVDNVPAEVRQEKQKQVPAEGQQPPPGELSASRLCCSCVAGGAGVILHGVSLLEWTYVWPTVFASQCPPKLHTYQPCPGGSTLALGSRARSHSQS